MNGMYKPKSYELVTVFVPSCAEEMSFIHVITFTNGKFVMSFLTE